MTEDPERYPREEGQPGQTETPAPEDEAGEC